MTGGSRGIGRATSLQLAKEGAKVCVNYRQSDQEARSLAKEISQLGSEAMTVKANVAEIRDVRRMVRRLLESYGKVDILVNCAGIIHAGDFMTLDDALSDEMYAVNVKGVVNCTREVARGMIRRRSGSIVNICSVAALGTSVTKTAHYSMSKAAVLVLTKKLALELGPYGIRVNGIAPGYVRTDMNMAGKTKAEFERTARDYARKMIVGRIGEPGEIATVVAFLASDDSSFVTGQTLTVDGGRMDMLSYSQ